MVVCSCGRGMWLFSLQLISRAYNPPPAPQMRSKINGSVWAGIWLTVGGGGGFCSRASLTMSPSAPLLSLHLPTGNLRCRYLSCCSLTAIIIHYNYVTQNSLSPPASPFTSTKSINGFCVRVCAWLCRQAIEWGAGSWVPCCCRILCSYTTLVPLAKLD